MLRVPEKEETQFLYGLFRLIGGFLRENMVLGINEFIFCVKFMNKLSFVADRILDSYKFSVEETNLEVSNSEFSSVIE